MLQQKILTHPITRILIAIILIAGSVVAVELLRAPVLDKLNLSANLENTIAGVLQIGLALLWYVLFFHKVEERPIQELAAKNFWRYSSLGCLLGIGFQAISIQVIYSLGHYHINSTNPISALFPGLITAIVAGFIMEILLRGIFFRIVESRLGSLTTIGLVAILFAVIHSGSKGASMLSVLATSTQAGILLSVLYVYSRSLWLPIFFHLGWDFAEPSIFGGINPGIGIHESLFTSSISGPNYLTGGEAGPGNSLQALVICLIASFLFLFLAMKKGNLIQPYWKKQPSNG